MKKILSIVAMAVVLLLANGLQAQLSVNAGYNHANLKNHQEYTAGSVSIKNDTTLSMGGGFYIGASYNVSLMEGLGVAPGIYFNLTTRSDENTFGSITNHSKVTFTNINVPILLNYRYGVSSDLGVSAFLGPNIAFGITSKSKSWVNDNKDDAIEGNGYEKDDDGDASFSRFDLGLMFGVGVDYMNIRFNVGYNMGLLNRIGYELNDNNKSTQKFNHLFVGVGYNF